MKREKFRRLTRAFSVRLSEHYGSKLTGEMLKKQRDNDYKDMLKTHGSYQAAWDWMKPARDLVEM